VLRSTVVPALASHLNQHPTTIAFQGRVFPAACPGHVRRRPGHRYPSSSRRPAGFRPADGPPEHQGLDSSSGCRNVSPPASRLVPSANRLEYADGETGSGRHSPLRPGAWMTNALAGCSGFRPAAGPLTLTEDRSWGLRAPAGLSPPGKPPSRDPALAAALAAEGRERLLPGPVASRAPCLCDHSLGARRVCRASLKRLTELTLRSSMSCLGLEPANAGPLWLGRPLPGRRSPGPGDALGSGLGSGLLQRPC